jgi:hypothetical protein
MTITSIRPDRHDQTAARVVAFLGTGRLGATTAGVTVTKVHGSRSVYPSQPRAVTSVTE